MSQRRQTEYANQRASFVVHYELVDRALKSVDLFLDRNHDLLNLLDASRVGSC